MKVEILSAPLALFFVFERKEKIDLYLKILRQKIRDEIKKKTRRRNILAIQNLKLS